ncbi:30S ribosomal protein S18 [PVC group bacterium]|nr:30S ribosomal protein S18 [PVC group bacterium]
MRKNTRNTKGSKGKGKGLSILKFKRRKCYCCVNKVETINYKEVDLLKRYVTDRGKIIPRRTTGACAKHQRRIVSAIKKARSIALLPFVA